MKTQQADDQGLARIFNRAINMADHKHLYYFELTDEEAKIARELLRLHVNGAKLRLLREDEP